jgi:hypothetical protein
MDMWFEWWPGRIDLCALSARADPNCHERPTGRYFVLESWLVISSSVRSYSSVVGSQHPQALPTDWHTKTALAGQRQP